MTVPDDTQPRGAQHVESTDDFANRAHPLFFNCALSDNLKRKALGGHLKSVVILVRFFPSDAPPALRHHVRDEVLRDLSQQLRNGVPGILDRAIARLILAA